MGSLESSSSTRCRYAGCFALGFVSASLVLAAMFWIIWCYLGLTIVQISDTQRRALVNYSYTTSKPSTTSKPPTTSTPTNHTEVDGALESSLNSISKSAVTPPIQSRRRSNSSTDLAKGDFAARPQGGASQNSTKRESIAPSVTSSSHERKASILHEGEEDSLHPRKVSTSNTEYRAPGESLPEIKPTQTYASAQSDPLPTAPKEERRPISRDSDRKDDVEGSRLSYRDPDFEKEPPPRRSEPGRRRYDDKDEYYGRGSPSRYDERDRGRDTDDRYSKGDTRVHPDERTILDDKYPPRDSDRPRGDARDREDRYRDREDRYRDRVDRDREDRYRDKEDRHSDYDDRYRDKEDRPRDYDDRYRDKKDRPRDYDDRYRDKEDKPRDYDDRYRDKEDRPRDYDDRYRDKEDRPKDYDDRYRDKEDRPRDYDDRYRDKEDRPRDYDDRYRDKEDRPRDYDDRYKDREDRPRDYDDRYRERDRPYLDDERNRKRDDRYDDRYISRSDSYIPKYPEDDYRSRERPYYDRRDRDDEDRYTLSREREYRKPIMSSRDGRVNASVVSRVVAVNSSRVNG